MQSGLLRPRERYHQSARQHRKRRAGCQHRHQLAETGPHLKQVFAKVKHLLRNRRTHQSAQLSFSKLSSS